MKPSPRKKDVLSSLSGDSTAGLSSSAPRTASPEKRHVTGALLLSLVTVMAFTSVRGQPPAEFTYTSIDYPGAIRTVASGINPGGDIVGTYRDTSNVRHVFVFSKGAFSSFDYPGAVFTEARGISPSGEIVGDYRLLGENPGYAFHGYRMSPDGTFSPIDVPGWPYMYAQRILPDGTVLGCVHDANFAHMVGFVLSSEGSSILDVPQSMHNGATPDLGQIVGLFTDATGRGRAYIVQDGTFNPFDFPGSVSTSAWDINPSGAVVGSYSDAAGGHGFLMQDGQFMSIDFPGAKTTNAQGINPRGEIVGYYADSQGHVHAFVASPKR